jgi:16S rRNA (uracil1498-N3)-methyltransferase
MNLFYTPDIQSDLYSLNEEESSHCIRVLRLHKGGVIHLTNGKGDLFKAEITDDNYKCCKVKIIETISAYHKRNYYLHMAIAPTKNISRMEWFLEKATEIGVDEITPLICKHSERKSVNAERLNKILVAAMKQSLRTKLPVLNKERNFDDFVAGDLPSLKYICHYDEKNDKLKELYKKGCDAVIIIGPEGDFDPNEILKAKENNFIQINLGENRYRTETAALMACHTLHLLNE